MIFVKNSRDGKEVTMIQQSKINLSKIGWEGGGSTSIWIMSLNTLFVFFDGTPNFFDIHNICIKQHVGAAPHHKNVFPSPSLFLSNIIVFPVKEESFSFLYFLQIIFLHWFWFLYSLFNWILLFFFQPHWTWTVGRHKYFKDPLSKSKHSKENMEAFITEIWILSDPWQGPFKTLGWKGVTQLLF